MRVKQGDVYWVQEASPQGVGSRIAHPHVVINPAYPDRSNPSVVVCALTTNARKISIPGNILLEAGEANLPRPSIVEVSKVLTVDVTQLGDYIGTLSETRVKQILAGLRLVQTSFLPR